MCDSICGAEVHCFSNKRVLAAAASSSVAEQLSELGGGR